MAIKYFDIPMYVYHRAGSGGLARTNQQIPVVLIHAFPVDHRVWDSAAESLVEQTCAAGRDVTVLAVDMPGAGTNPVPPMKFVGDVAQDGAYTQAMDRMASSIVHAVEKQGFKRAIYVGISMGGYATLAIARLFPDSVAGIALCDTKADADNEVQRARRLAAAHAAESENSLAPVIHFAQPKDGDSDFKKSPEFINTFTRWINEQTPAGIAWRQRMAAGRRDEHDTVAELTVPVSVISGELDDSSNPTVMKPLADEMTHADVVFTQIDDAGHFTSFEKPYEVAAALAELVERVGAGTNAGAGGAGSAIVQDTVHSLSASLSAFSLSRPLETVPMSEGHVSWCIDQREKLGEEGLIEFLSDSSAASHTNVMLVKSGQVAVAKNGLVTTVTTAYKRRLATLPANYMTDVLCSHLDAVYFLGQITQPIRGEQATVLALDLDALSRSGDEKADRIVMRSQMQFDWLTLRAAAPVLSPDESQLAVMAAGLSAWHARTRFCSACGSRNISVNGGWVMRCEGKSREEETREKPHMHFPKIEPAMIVRITDCDDRILLQHNLAWADRMYSVCSGFVEVGENIEHAVHREVKEELGIDVTDVRYLGSQPWPLPASLMVAYSALTVDHDVKLDTAEVGDARWFTRDELMQALALDEVRLAGPSSIAMAMIEQWYGASLRS